MSFLKTMSKKNISRVIILFGIGLLLSSLYKIILMMFHYDHYVELFGYLPKEQFLLRYILSWADKILELVSAVGILYRNDLCRKIAIFTWFVIICAVPIKHPYVGFQNHVQYIIDHGIIDFKLIQALGISQEKFTWWAVWGARLQDVVFGVCLIYFFTRREVKEQFKN